MKAFSLFTLSFTALLAVSCSQSPDADQEEATAPKKKEAFEKRFIKEIEAKLKINRTEKYSYKVYKADINGDGIGDAIITVNRMQYAEDQAIASGNVAKAVEVGYVGPYNLFFYYDGALDLISDPVQVPSSPGRELDVHFESITSPDKKDIVIDYRVRNSGWRSYFTSSGQGTLSLMFQWKWFDYIGEANPEALNHVLEANPRGQLQDISIYQSSIDDYPGTVKDIYGYVPKITQKGALMYRFFYDPQVLKFRIYSPEMLKNMGLVAIGPLDRPAN